MSFTSKRAIRLMVFLLLIIGLLSHLIASSSAAIWSARNHQGRANEESFLPDHSAAQRGTINDQQKPRINQAFDNLPLSFEPNVGQYDKPVKFFCRRQGYRVGLAADFAVMSFASPSLPLENAPHQSSTVKLKFMGGNASPSLTGLDELPTKSNYFIGNHPANWQTNVSNFAKVKYANLYGGIDVIFYGNPQNLEYDFKLAVGADFKAIRLSFEGAKQLRIGEQGDLIIETTAGEIRQPKPVAYQEVNGERREIKCNYKLLDGAASGSSSRRKIRRLQAANRNPIVGFEVGEYDKSLPLVIDPVLVYSTALGGSQADAAADVAVDENGNVYLIGSTDSIDFPSPQAGVRSTQNVFIAKLDIVLNKLIYITFLSGLNASFFSTTINQGNSIALDSTGNAYLTGSTNGLDFPITTDALQRQLKGRISAFVTKLNQDGGIVYSTYLSGSESSYPIGLQYAETHGAAIAVDRFTNAYVTGDTNTTNFPTTPGALKNTTATDYCPLPLPPPPGLEEQPNGARIDAFVAKINPSGSALVYSTYLGGSCSDEGKSLAVDASGNAYVAGTTVNKDFPIANAIQKEFGGSNDAFVAKLNADGSALIYSTYIGSTGVDSANAIAIDSAGNAYVTGSTTSTDLPVTANALQPDRGNVALFKSLDAGSTWQSISKGLDSVHQVAVSPYNSTTLYADQGFYKSTDAGNTWQSLKTITGGTIAFDPKHSETLYSLSCPLGGIPLPCSLYKSTDAGQTWNYAQITSFRIGELLIAPSDKDTLYINIDVTNRYPPTTDSFRSTDGGGAWKNISGGLSKNNNSVLAVDPKNASIIFAQSMVAPRASAIFKSTNGGKKWHQVGLPNLYLISNIVFRNLVFDPTNSNTVYASGAGLYKSTDAGETWAEIESDFLRIGKLVIDPSNPLIIYTSASDSIQTGIFKSTDGGKTWKAAPLNLKLPRDYTLAIDPNHPATIYAGTLFTSSAPNCCSGQDAFAVKLNATGSAFTYFTYLGGSQSESASGIGVDTTGNAFITGQTYSTDFPVKNAFQPELGISPFVNADAFITKLSPNGELLYSTYLGGNRSENANTAGVDENGTSIAIDKFGNAYVAGSAYSINFPLVNALQKFGGEGDAFLAKIIEIDFSQPPLITAVSPSSGSSSGGTAITINGANFLSGAKVFIGSVPAKNTVVINANTIQAITDARKAGIVRIAVVNPDGQNAFLLPGFTYVPAPKINFIEIQGKELFIVGEGCDRGAVILINGQEVMTTQDLSYSGGQVVSSKKALKKLKPNQAAQVQVRNANGLLSLPQTFTRE